MNKALLDTDTLSEIGKGINPTIAAHATTYRRAFGYYTLSATSIALEDSRGSCPVIPSFPRPCWGAWRAMNDFPAPGSSC